MRGDQTRDESDSPIYKPLPRPPAIAGRPVDETRAPRLAPQRVDDDRAGHRRGAAGTGGISAGVRGAERAQTPANEEELQRLVASIERGQIVLDALALMQQG